MSVSADWLNSCTVDEALRAYQALPPEFQAEWDEHLLALTPHVQPTEPPTFEEFAEATLPFPLHDWQRKVLCPLIQRLAEERGLRVAIHAPPQYGKTVLLSQRAPAWLLGVDPLHRIGLACYNETHATGFGAVVRDLMLSPDYGDMFPGEASRIKKDAAEGKFFTVARKARSDGQPSFNAMGLLSGFTGRGVDSLIIDDPYKSDEEAHSEVINEKVWRFWDATARPRIGEEANVVVMFHRYHDNDLAGRLLAQKGWEYIRLPVVADENEDGSDPSGRAVGELLSPMRSRDWVDAQQRANPRVFAGQFQGRPRTDEGGIFKQAWFRYYTEEEEFFLLEYAEGRKERVRKADCWYFASVDFAASDLTSADWTVVAVWAVTPRKQRVLVNVAREQFEGPEAKGLVRQAYARYPLSFAAVERNGLALPMVQDLVREGYPVRGIVVHKSKIARAQGNAAYYETGTVFHPKEAPWLDGWEKEHLAMGPVAAHDDQVDTGSIAAETIKPESEIITEFSQALHVALDPLGLGPAPLLNGWCFDPYPSWVLCQMDQLPGRENSGQLRVLAAMVGRQEEGVYGFAERVLGYLRRNGLEGEDLRHYSHPRHLGMKGHSGKHTEAWLNLTGVESHVGFDHRGRPLAVQKPPLKIDLTPGEPSRETRDELLRARLTTLVGGRPALLVDPQAKPVTEALTGGYRWKVAANSGMPTGEVEPNQAAAVVEALTTVLSCLYASAERPEWDEAPVFQGTASGAGSRRDNL